MLNQCQFIGNLGADPEVRRQADGRPVVNLRIAVTEKWRDKSSGQQKERTEWIRAVLFAEGLCKIAEQYLQKGSKVFISGKMQTRSWKNQDGKDQYSTEIVLTGFDAKLQLLDSKNQSQGQSSGQRDQGFGGQSGGFGGDMNDSIPFLYEWRI